MQEAKLTGKPCRGSLSTMVPCNTAPCPGEEPVDCVWDNWGSWTACPVTCNGGEMSRQRTVRLEAKRGGTPCNTSSTTQVAKCNARPCTEPEYCVWASWSSWDSCSATCDGGSQKRRRVLIDDLGLASGTSPGEALGLEEEAPSAAPGDGGPGRGIAAELVGRHRLQVCALAAVGAMSLVWMSVQGMRQAHAFVSQRRSTRGSLQYMALATEDPATVGEEDEECPALATRFESMRQ